MNEDLSSVKDILESSLNLGIKRETISKTKHIMRMLKKHKEVRDVLLFPSSKDRTIQINFTVNNEEFKIVVL